MATRKALGQIPGGWAVIDPVTEWSMTCNTSLWPLLGLTGGRIRPDPINRLVPTCPSTLFFLISWSYHTICSCRTIRSTFAELFPTLYSIHARRRGLRVNCAEVGLMTAVRLLFFKSIIWRERARDIHASSTTWWWWQMSTWPKKGEATEKKYLSIIEIKD